MTINPLDRLDHLWVVAESSAEHVEGLGVDERRRLMGDRFLSKFRPGSIQACN